MFIVNILEELIDAKKHDPITLTSKVPSVVNFRFEKFIVPLDVVPDIIPCILFVGETDREISYDPEVVRELHSKFSCVSTIIVKMSSVV